uniref:Uncharacterized protein n=1 Tax=Chromera velia CCMP2878 TaxID=1169474 RepID=A0A0G4I0L2_9ALVE|eukprot:Cvel_9964.t1-p1 / transcript=Cvel_9964.t1 / gene=Cvel_9964 / organism=Chromera_velia_CCMP2878 / gene_product=Cadmium metallothionein, putative / transcript_product=Cadmium metallothionein, putative / location=Cvel_scaffold590:24826-27636(+) / protein_length=364 / sequence_SO=supercontig / SO=protein_coding / is_pseudo=false
MGSPPRAARHQMDSVRHVLCPTTRPTRASAARLTPHLRATESVAILGLASQTAAGVHCVVLKVRRAATGSAAMGAASAVGRVLRLSSAALLKAKRASMTNVALPCRLALTQRPAAKAGRSALGKRAASTRFCCDDGNVCTDDTCENNETNEAVCVTSNNTNSLTTETPAQRTTHVLGGSALALLSVEALVMTEIPALRTTNATPESAWALPQTRLLLQVGCPAVLPGALAACCLPEGGCRNLNSTDCSGSEGERNPKASCETADCRVGVCCVEGSACEVLTRDECEEKGGTFKGKATKCSKFSCLFASDLFGGGQEKEKLLEQFGGIPKTDGEPWTLPKLDLKGLEGLDLKGLEELGKTLKFPG